MCLSYREPWHGTLELISRDRERNGATKMSALAVRGDDPAWCMKQEEAPFAEEDRAIVRLRELREDLSRRANGDGRAEAGDARHAQERCDDGDELHDDERHHAGEPDAQELAPMKARAVDG